jgi:hypothetical protein
MTHVEKQKFRFSSRNEGVHTCACGTCAGERKEPVKAEDSSPHTCPGERCQERALMHRFSYFSFDNSRKLRLAYNRLANPPPFTKTHTAVWRFFTVNRSMNVKQSSQDRHIISTPEHRLRVFVSSTLKELATEREVVTAQSKNNLNYSYLAV